MNIYLNNKKSIAFLATIVGLFFVASNAYALTLSPIRLEITGNPGDTVKSEMILTNESDGQSNYFSSYANFEASGETGNPSFVKAENDIGTWITTDEVVALKPKESKIVSFSINIPKDAEPGGHYGAIFWSQNQDKTNTGVGVSAKTGILVLLSVSGNVKEGGGLLSFGTKDNKIFYNTLPVSFNYRFKNDGGDRIKPVGKITMHDLFYIPESKIDANPSSGNILPSSTRRFDVDWVKNPRAKDYVVPTGVPAKFFGEALYQWHNFAIGPYFARMSLLYGTNATRVTKTTFIFVFPWQLIICLIVILVAVFWGGKKLIRRYNRHIIQKARAGMSMPNAADHV